MADAAPPPARPNGQWSQLPLPVRYLKNWVRRHRLAPYLLLLPSAAAIGLLLVWPAIQLGIYSFLNVTAGNIVTITAQSSYPSSTNLAYITVTSDHATDVITQVQIGAASQTLASVASGVRTNIATALTLTNGANTIAITFGASPAAGWP